MALVDMKRTPAEKKAEKAKYDSIGPASGDDYPYGLHINLDHEMLSKLGIDKLPAVGDKMHLHAHAHVTEVSEESREGGKKRRSLRLQMRKMQVEPATKPSAAEGAKAAMDKALAGEDD